MKIWSRRIAQNMNEKIWKILPQVFRAEFFNFFVHILGNATISYFHSEISWPLHKIYEGNSQRILQISSLGYVVKIILPRMPKGIKES